MYERVCGFGFWILILCLLRWMVHSTQSAHLFEQLAHFCRTGAHIGRISGTLGMWVNHQRDSVMFLSCSLIIGLLFESYLLLTGLPYYDVHQKTVAHYWGLTETDIWPWSQFNNINYDMTHVWDEKCKPAIILKRCLKFFSPSISSWMNDSLFRKSRAKGRLFVFFFY